MAIVVQETWILAAALIAAVGYIGLAYVVSELYKYVPEWSKFARARKKHLPLISLTTPGSGEAVWLVGEKDEKGDPCFDTAKEFGIQVDPKFSGSVVPDRYQGGLAIYHFATTLPFAMDARHALALQSTIQTVRKRYPQLDFLTNDQLMALLSTDRDDLGKYCEDFIEVYGPELGPEVDMDENDLSYMIAEAQEVLANTAIRGGWHSYAFAFKNIATSYLAQDMHQYGMLIERKIRKQMEDFSKKMMFFTVIAFAFVLVAIGGAIAYQIIK